MSACYVSHAERHGTKICLQEYCGDIVNVHDSAPYRLRRRISADIAGVAKMASLPTITWGRGKGVSCTAHTQGRLSGEPSACGE